MTIADLIKKLVEWLQTLFADNTAYTIDEQVYRQRVAQLIDYYKGNQLTYLRDVLSKQFKDADKLMMQHDMSNIVRYITDTRCMTFKHGAIVTARNTKDQPLWDIMLDQVQFDAFVKTLEQTNFLTKTCFTKVTPLLVSGSNDFERMNLSIITPEFTTVVPKPEDPLEIQSIVYPKKISRESQEGVYAYWDAQTFQFVDEGGAALPISGNASGSNPYGIVPVAVFREKVPVDADFYQWPSEELIIAQDNLNAKLTFLNYMIKMQSFAQPVIINPQQNYDGKVQIQIGPAHPIVIKNDGDVKGDFKFVTPETKINDVQDSIDKAYIRTFSFYGLNASDFVASGDAKSAEAMRENNAKIEEYRANIRQVFIPQLERLLEIMRVVWNKHHGTDQQISHEGVMIKIQQSRVSYQSIDDQIKDLDWQRQYGYLNDNDIMVILNDDLTTSEAEKVRTQNVLKLKQQSSGNLVNETTGNMN